MTDHYYSENPESELKIIEINDTVFNKKIKIKSASGLFSKDHIDKGSKLLIENAIIEHNSSLLDLGCGYGIVGIAISKEYNIKNIMFSDINNRATQITRLNCQELKIENFKVRKSNGFDSIKDSFDTILLNPPQTAGKETCFKMISDSISHINKNGTLQIVARHNKGGKTLSLKMEDIFGNVKSLIKTGGWRIYLSKKNN